MERARYQISFDLEDPWHRKAAQCVEQHGRRRSEYIVGCIMIAERLQEVQPDMNTQPEKPEQQIQPETEKGMEPSALPESLRDFTKQF